MSGSNANLSLPAPGGLDKRSNKKILIIALGAVLLALGGLGTAGWLLGYFGTNAEGDVPAREQSSMEPTVPVMLIDLPEVTTSIIAPGRRAVFVRVRSQVEIRGSEGAEHLQRLMPRVVDLFQTYLRDMRREEFHNERAMERLRQELLTRINILIEPAKAERLLFREIIVQ